MRRKGASRPSLDRRSLADASQRLGGGSWILSQAGEAEAALEEIERLLVEPSSVTLHGLRLDPRWDRIRDHPRFQALLAEHSEP